MKFVPNIRARRGVWAVLFLLAPWTQGPRAAEPGAAPDSTALFPPELVNFTPADPQPIFGGAGPGHWDAAIRERGWILHEADGWRMWYTGYDGTRAGRKLLGYASSSDGLTWERAPQPIYDQGWVEDVTVTHLGDTYYLFAEGEGDRAQWFTSPDGIHWTRQGTLDIRYTDGRPLSPGPFGTPAVWHEDGTWYLMYERGDRAVWLATSSDLSVWKHVQDEPVMTPTAAENGMIAINQVIRRDGRYFAYYHALADEEQRAWSTNIATSEDLRTWTRYAGNPLLVHNQSSGILVGEGPKARLYSMHPEVRVHYVREAAEDSKETPAR